MNILSRIRDIRPRVKYMMSRIRDYRPMSVNVKEIQMWMVLNRICIALISCY